MPFGGTIPFMAMIFLSYRRSDGPQACRVHDWLAQRFGNDAVFMDVSAIPFAVSFPEFIKENIAGSKVVIALIGTDWSKRMAQAEDPVLMEIETALAHKVPVLPVLIGSTPMPIADDLPKSIAMISYQNALTVGLLQDFDTHMRTLVPKIELILGRLSTEGTVTANADVIRLVCDALIEMLRTRYNDMNPGTGINWQVFGTGDFDRGVNTAGLVTLYLHRISPIGELLDLHFILSFWAAFGNAEHLLAGWVLRELDRTPVIPETFLDPGPVPSTDFNVKVRRSDEDPRQVWKMITDQPLRLSLAYVATVSPKTS